MTDPNGSAGSGQPGADGGAGAGAAVAAPWFGADAPDDIKGFVELKGWDSPAKAVTSYRDLEKFLGADKAGRGVVWPKDEADAEGWKAINARLGVPESPDGYKLPLPEGDDGSFAKAAAPALHKLGISAKQAKGLAQFLNEHSAAQQQAYDAEVSKLVETQKADLTAEWGAAATQNLSIAKRSALALGFDEATINALEGSFGYKAVMNAMLKVGQKIGEDSFVGSDAQPGGRQLSVEAARQRFEQLKGDSGWMAKLMSGDTNALAEKEQLDANMLGMTLSEYRAALKSA